MLERTAVSRMGVQLVEFSGSEIFYVTASSASQ